MELEKKGKIILLSGPSGVGKGSIWKGFATRHNLEKFHLAPSVSMTTRKKRANEIPGESYFFVTKEIFLENIYENNFLEYEEYADNYYGTLKSFVAEKINAGMNVYLEIEVKGAKKVLEQKDFEVFSIFIMPPSLNDLISRIYNRNTDSKEAIAQRLEIAKKEILENSLFDVKIINANLSDAIAEFQKILTDVLIK